ncbi:MAG: hypothetical protein R3E96_16670 [Planctomycetota bacterium]
MDSLIRFTVANAGDTFLLQVGGYGTNSGSMILNIGPELCGNLVDDALEPNDSCASPRVLTPGTYNGLITHFTDSDSTG